MSMLLPVIFLSLFGIFNLFGFKPHLFYNQINNILVGLFLFLIIRKFGLVFFRRNAFLFYWLLVLTIIALYFIGLEVKGAKRWINIFFFNFQPSEFLKVFYILFLADFFAKSRSSFNKLSTFLLSLVYFLIPFVLIYKQPDLGTSLIFAFSYFLLLLFSGLPKKYIIYLCLILLASLPLNWLLLKDYQRERITSFINPQVDQEGTSYNMIQAVITSGSGGFIGRGLGLGTQSRLYFLPENHTDFAYSSLVEQFGFIGGAAVILLYLILAILLIKKLLHYLPLIKETDSQYHFLYLIGFLSLLLFQVFVNIGMNIGIIPVAGIGLPFISYGGSSIITYIIAFALIP